MPEAMPEATILEAVARPRADAHPGGRAPMKRPEHSTRRDVEQLLFGFAPELRGCARWAATQQVQPASPAVDRAAGRKGRDRATVGV